MCRYVLAVLALPLFCAAAEAVEPPAVQLSMAELGVAEAELNLARAQKELALDDAPRELADRISDLSRQLGTAKAKLDAMPRGDLKRMGPELIVMRLERDLELLKKTGPIRLERLRRVWELKVGLAEAKLVVARVRVKIAAQQTGDQPEGN